MLRHQGSLVSQALLLLGLVFVLGTPSPAQSPRRSCTQMGGEPGNCPRRDRPQTSFSEEESRGIDERGFSDSFLSDALEGVADPLNGGAGITDVGGLEGEQVQNLNPVDRGLTDPTGVFIPVPSLP
ncbi:hypothetical protein NEA10_01160 [Phormidium yuhuli AB48]|uniref:Uncharacterized protein n=1 Tax=Phormidium yuhuli AB48 TaxID=2940671 RepID=A0ABY5ATC0_9CYAN|nr:hypothetical protein [Phormidium yuhuli]USR91383.1 hypothetical protein NEA10_01160 [Phormidium yuhuli AB48]